MRSTMEARSWRRLVKNGVLPQVPELVLSGSLLHLPDPEWLLCAAVKDDSGFSKDFTIWVIVMPLYEPTDHLGWLVGERLGHLTEGHDIWWEPENQSTDAIATNIAQRLRAGALPFWQRFGNLDAFANECRGRGTFGIDSHYVEWVAGAAVITGSDDLASAAFDAARKLEPQYEYQREAQQRVFELEAAWARDPSAAVDLLAGRRAQTASALGLG